MQIRNTTTTIAYMHCPIEFKEGIDTAVIFDLGFGPSAIFVVGSRRQRAYSSRQDEESVFSGLLQSYLDFPPLFLHLVSIDVISPAKLLLLSKSMFWAFKKWFEKKFRWMNQYIAMALSLQNSYELE